MYILCRDGVVIVVAIVTMVVIVVTIAVIVVIAVVIFTVGVAVIIVIIIHVSKFHSSEIFKSRFLFSLVRLVLIDIINLI